MRRVRIGSAAIAVDDEQPTFWDRVQAGTWEAGTIAVYERETGPNTFVLDLGAWVGPLALLAACRGARVVAVEADPAAAAQFRRNRAANPALTDRVALYEAAVAPEVGLVRLGSRRKPGDSMSSVMLADGAGAWTVDAITPARLADERRPGESLFVKLDIEGGEYALLPVLWPVLAAAGGTLLLSLHPESLREVGERDPVARTRAALAGAAGWSMTRIDGPAASAGEPAELASGSTWLCKPPSSARPAA